MTHHARTCRFCRELTTDPMVKYSTRHYAHADCFLDAGHGLTELTPWQIGQIPYRILSDRGLIEEAQRIVDDGQSHFRRRPTPPSDLPMGEF